MSSIIIERKAGDRLNISGRLDEETPLPDSAWVGATAVINIADAATGAVVVNRAAVTLDTTVTPKTVDYDGTSIDDVGTYTVEFEVTLAGGKVRTWPNYRDGKCTLKVIAEIA
jgi:hypothetical protein